MRDQPNLNHRQKTLLGLLNAFGGRLSNVDLQKYLFLYTVEFQNEPSFEFVPYKFGGFSFSSYADKRRLTEVEAIIACDDWKINKQVVTPDLLDDGNYKAFFLKYSELKGDKLVRDVYRRYPYYAINSEIASRLMNDLELETIKQARPRVAKACLFTIGYEGSSLEGYINRLIKNDVKTLVDVRRNPLSRKYGFSKKTLSDTLNKLGIEYVHIPELGISSDKRQELNTQADYNRLFAAYEKNELRNNHKSLEELLGIVQAKKRVAITCFEAHVCMCHRGRVAAALSKLPAWKFDIQHI